MNSLKVSCSSMISVCILTKNSCLTLRATLDSLQSFSEVIILDTGSTDETIAIAKEYPNVTVHFSPFIGFGPLRNYVSKLASHDWILSIDSDEILSSTLIQELNNLSLDPNVTYSIPRHNYYNGKRIRGCGWDKEQIPRLYYRPKICFSNVQVHEAVLAQQTQKLCSPLLHTPYRSTTDFLAKMQHYTTLFAEQYQGKRGSSFGKALAHGFYAFFRSYFLKRGIFCGAEGFTISLYNANTAFYKYLKLAEKYK